MAEEILGEAFDLGNALDTVDSADALSSLNQEFAESFPNMASNGFEGISYVDDEPVITNSDGSSVKLSDIYTDLANGDYEDFLSKLKVDVDDPTVQEVIDRLNADFEQSPAGQLQTDEAETADRAADLPKNMDNAVDDPSLQSSIVNGEFTGSAAGSDVETMTKEIQSIQQDAIQRGATGPDDPEFKANVQDWFDKYGKGFGRLLMKGIEIFAIFWLAKSLYDLLKQIAAAMSGCWSTQSTVSASARINYIRHRVQAMLVKKGKLARYGSSQSGTCKIEPLTCNPADLVNPTVGKGYVACTPCIDVTNTANCDWIPLRVGTSCTCYTTKGNLYPGEYDPGATTGTNPCTGVGQSPCTPPNPSKENYSRVSTDVSTDVSYACPGANGCIAKAEACASTPTADCSSWCNNQYVVTLPGQAISCKQCSITCAFANVMDNFAPAVSNLFGTIEKVLLWVAVGVVILIVLFVVFKEIMHATMKGGESNSQQSGRVGNTVRIEVVDGKATLPALSSSDTDDSEEEKESALPVQPTPKRSVTDQIKYKAAQRLQQALVDNQDQLVNIAQAAGTAMQQASAKSAKSTQSVQSVQRVSK